MLDMLVVFLVCIFVKIMLFRLSIEKAKRKRKKIILPPSMPQYVLYRIITFRKQTAN